METVDLLVGFPHQHLHTVRVYQGTDRHLILLVILWHVHVRVRVLINCSLNQSVRLLINHSFYFFTGYSTLPPLAIGFLLFCMFTGISQGHHLSLEEHREVTYNIRST